MSPEERYRAHQGLVRAYAGRLYQAHFIEYEDAVAWGSLGLWQAVQKDHPNWIAYARTRIDGAIRDGARTLHGRFRGFEHVRPHHVPLIEGLIPWEERCTDPVEPEPWLGRAMACLKPREADVIRSFFGGEPLQDIAQRLGVSQPRASQMKRTALRKLKEYLLKPCPDHRKQSR